MHEQQRLWRDCAVAQARQSLRFSHAKSMHIDTGSDQNLDLEQGWMAAGHLLETFEHMHVKVPKSRVLVRIS